MTSIPMSEFVDFILTSGTGRLTTVRAVKQGQDDRFSDFYKPIRESIVDAHEKGLDVPDSLADFLTTLVDTVSPRAAEFIDRMVSMSTPKDSPENALLRAFNAGGGRSYSGAQRRDICARAALAAIRGEKVKLLRPILADARSELFGTVKIAFPTTLL